MGIPSGGGLMYDDRLGGLVPTTSGGGWECHLYVRIPLDSAGGDMYDDHYDVHYDDHSRPTRSSVNGGARSSALALGSVGTAAYGIRSR